MDSGCCSDIVVERHTRNPKRERKVGGEDGHGRGHVDGYFVSHFTRVYSLVSLPLQVAVSFFV